MNPHYIDIAPWIAKIRTEVEATANERARFIGVEFRESQDPNDDPVVLTAKFGDRTYYGFGPNGSAALDKLVRKIEPGPDLAAILGYEEVRS